MNEIIQALRNGLARAIDNEDLEEADYYRTRIDDFIKLDHKR